MAYGYLQNPYDADRNIHGRWGRVFLASANGYTIPATQLAAGDWVAQATEISYAVAIDKSEVKRSGTRWNDNKPGAYTGTGTLTYDKVNSLLETILIPFINGAGPTGVVTLTDARRMPAFTVQVQLEDPGQPSAEWDADGNMVKGMETVQLDNVKFWNLEGGYGSDMVTRSVEFTFSGVSLVSQIDDPPVVP